MHSTPWTRQFVLPVLRKVLTGPTIEETPRLRRRDQNLQLK